MSVSSVGQDPVSLLADLKTKAIVLIHLILSSSVLWSPLQVENAAVPGAKLPAQVRKLVEQLDSDLLAQRQSAERALIALGPEVLNHLPKIKSLDSAEVRQRLQRVVKTLQLQASHLATAASRVDLKGTMDFATVLQALEPQTGNRIEVQQQFKAPVRVDFQQLSFWEALDRILDQVQMDVDPVRGGRTAVGLRARPEEERARQSAASYGGIFRFEPMRVEASRHLRNPQIRGLKVALQVAWEPRLRPIFLSIPAAHLSAQDDQGKMLAIDNPRGVSSAAIEGDGTAVELTLPLQLPSRAVRKIASLKGQLVTLMPGRLEQFEFSRFKEKNQVQKKAGVTVILQQVEQGPEDLVVKMKVAYERADQAFESHRGWVFSNPASLQSTTAKPIAFTSYETLEQGPRSVTLAYHFRRPKDLQNVRFVYKTPASIIRQQVSFQLREIPLP